LHHNAFHIRQYPHDGQTRTKDKTGLCRNHEKDLGARTLVL
jgi:hypothetical protein